MSDPHLLHLMRGTVAVSEAVNISWLPEVDVPYNIHSEGAVTPPSMSVDGQDLVVGDLRFQLIFQAKLWWRPPTFGEGPWIYMSAYQEAKGWDGPFGIGWGSKVYGFIPSGEGSILCQLPRHQNQCLYSLKDVVDPRFYACRWLQNALKLKRGARHQICLQRFHQQEIAFLVCLRMAYPDEYFELQRLPTKADREPQWKRLCQNLGVRCGKAPVWKDQPPEVLMPRTELFVDNPREILQLFNQNASVVPESLWLS